MSNYLSNTANQEFAAAQDNYETSLQHLKNAGDALIQIKESMDHGQWLPWLEDKDNWHYSARQAQQCMRIASNWDALPNTKDSAYLSVDGALKALAKPKTDTSADDGARKAAHKATSAPTSAANADTAQLQQEVAEARQNASELASQLEAVEYANEGAERAAKEIMSKDEQIAALKAENAQLQEQLARWKAKAKHWEKVAKANAGNNRHKPA